MEASALQAPAGLARQHLATAVPLMRVRSDEQLVALFRQGYDDAFRVIHDRYRQRLFAYTRQMLPGSRQDAEDALQDVFVRAYSALRASDRDLALRAWLYRVAHNRCIDELRRPVPAAPELIDLVSAPMADPIAEAERRESLRRLIADVRRLPAQQRSALLLRELSGMSYAELADVLAVSVPAVKSLLVRARVSLAQAAEARDTACAEIREEMILAHDRGVRPAANSRRHLRDCPACRQFRGEIRGVSRQLAAFAPTVGPAAVLANMLGIGGTAGGGAAAGSGAAVAGSGGVFLSGGVIATGAGHVATLLAAAVVTAGGAIEFQAASTSPPPTHRAPHTRAAASRAGAGGPVSAGSPSAVASIPAAVVRSSVTASDLAVARTVPAITGDVVMRHHRVGRTPPPGGGATGSAGTTATSTGTSGPVTPTGSATTPTSPGTVGTATSSAPSGSSTTTAPDQSTGVATTTGTGSTDTSGAGSSTATPSGPSVGTAAAGPSGSTPATSTGSNASTSTGTPAPTGTSAATVPAGH